ncbi:TetR family transcriptional regulator [Sphingomonas sp. DBB INV C78]|uniref:TetR/AcrR family transcriptional regulator n=1 Tax=Sphingomonas sp. DBB INV C78 TaxID=3349434 RepID=UPI0036D309F2
MPRITEERLQDRRASIIAAARQVFAEKGYEQSAINDIAQIAGTSDGLIYHYFDGKKGLLVEVIDSVYRNLIEGTESAIAEQTDFRGMLTVLVDRHVHSFADDPDLSRLFIAEIRNFDDHADSAGNRLNHVYSSVFLRVLAKGVEEGKVSGKLDPRLVRDIFFGGIKQLALRHISDGVPLEVASVTRQVVAFLIGGLAATDA